MGTPSKSTFWLCMFVLKVFGAVVSASAIYVGILLFRTVQPFVASPPDGEALIVNVLYYTGIAFMTAGCIGVVGASIAAFRAFWFLTRKTIVAEIATAIVALLLLVALLLALGTAGTSVIAIASVELSTAIQQLNITITSLCTTPDTCAALVSTVFEHIALYIYIVGGVLIGLQVVVIIVGIHLERSRQYVNADEDGFDPYNGDVSMLTLSIHRAITGSSVKKAPTSTASTSAASSPILGSAPGSSSPHTGSALQLVAPGDAIDFGDDRDRDRGLGVGRASTTANNDPYYTMAMSGSAV